MKRYYLRVKHGDSFLYWDGELWVRRRDQALRIGHELEAHKLAAEIGQVMETSDGESAELQPGERAPVDGQEAVERDVEGQHGTEEGRG